MISFSDIYLFFLAMIVTIALYKIFSLLNDSASGEKLGGRPRRKKKPTYRISDNSFAFEGSEESTLSQAYVYTNEMNGVNVSITFVLNTPPPVYQEITFAQPIPGEIDEITIEFE